MSNIYIQEPPTEGKVLLTTTAGDIDIELWSKEAPKACRNFIQLCLEKYYDGTIFHRVIPNFIVQGGDPTGTGMGGESIYGKPFKDEFHSRLRFVRRGLVAMANSQPNDNGSQFFITLGACPELQNKHTIFGKVAGNTIYNLPRFEEGEIGKDDKPEYPHKILSTDVLKNPFTDIVPRETMKIENEVVKESKKTKGKKNFKLLSFGDEAEEDEELLATVTKSMPNKSNSAHDIAKDPTLSSAVQDAGQITNELQRIKEKLNKEQKSLEDLEPKLEEEIPDDNKQHDRNQKRLELKAEVRKLKRELLGKSNKRELPSQEDEESKDVKKSKEDSAVLKQYYDEIAKYEENRKVIPKKGTSRESQTLLLLQRFANKVKDASNLNTEEEEKMEETAEDDDDEDESWLSHRLQFDDTEPVLARDASTKNDDWYDITDPRNALNKRRRKEPTSKAT